MVEFTDSYPIFGKSNRHNKRYQAMFASRPGLFRDARVLDIASHDGRWSFASLTMGAAHVTGVEPRQNLVARSLSNFDSLAVPRGAYRFRQSDIFDFFQVNHEMFDVILCLGFMYHTYRHPEIMAHIRKRNPRSIIIDSQVNQLPGLACTIHKDHGADDYQAVTNDTSISDYTYCATPSVELIKQMVWDFGYRCEMVDWGNLLGTEPGPDVEDYASGKRVTAVGSRRAA